MSYITNNELNMQLSTDTCQVLTVCLNDEGYEMK